MPTLNACLQVARIAEASGIPYIQKLAKVTVAVVELLEQWGKNKKNIKALCESIANTVVVINTVALTSLAQDLKTELERKHCGVKGFFKTKELQETIQDFRIRINDLRTDFMIHCLLILVELHPMLTPCPVVDMSSKHRTK
ncbi:hypothetical protein EDD18DRAFT_1113374 [Armillaria luteobubalina]|uniref:Uncharacterized protein n=1 Tax=Armillaria luteobubalina TaxID=153913 RepID=A0AA39PBU9_9AGAR|nr:hypothetical protein EDD18DRAFT_1113374 [Armillaria luteobubalina]